MNVMMLWAFCGLLALTKAQEICYNRGNYSYWYLLLTLGTSSFE